MATAVKYPVELKERAVAMVGELERELGSGRGAIARVAKQLGVHPEGTVIPVEAGPCLVVRGF
jgi:transposase